MQLFELSVKSNSITSADIEAIFDEEEKANEDDNNNNNNNDNDDDNDNDVATIPLPTISLPSLPPPGVPVPLFTIRLPFLPSQIKGDILPLFSLPPRSKGVPLPSLPP